MIFNIQKCSIHDGTGMRTIVFFKGCPLKCEWCANPESQSYEKEIMEIPRKCIGCGACIRNCPVSAISVIDGQCLIDRDKCIKCFKCTDVCYAESKELVGMEMSTEEIYKKVNSDRMFYQQYGGGVTFSGGEPLTHVKDLLPLAIKCHRNRIHTAMETCGFGNFEQFKEVLPYLDEMFFDLKHIDPEIHEKLTGVRNDVIIENLKKIAEYNIPITIRTPVIPGVNDSEENITGIAELIKDISAVRDYELLPYHKLGLSKYESLARDYTLKEVKQPTNEQMYELVRVANKVLEASGKPCFVTVKNRKEIIK